MAPLPHPRVYVAAPYEDAGYVREIVHERLRLLGFEVASHWAERATGAEDFTRFTADELRVLAERNDVDVASARVLLVLARPGAGGEMFAEARYALSLGIPCVWVGRRTLSSWRTGVVRVDDLDGALDALLRGTGAVDA